MMSNDHYRTENLSAVLCFSGSTIQHQAVGMHAIATNNHGSKENRRANSARAHWTSCTTQLLAETIEKAAMTAQFTAHFRAQL